MVFTSFHFNENNDNNNNNNNNRQSGREIRHGEPVPELLLRKRHRHAGRNVRRVCRAARVSARRAIRVLLVRKSESGELRVRYWRATKGRVRRHRSHRRRKSGGNDFDTTSLQEGSEEARERKGDEGEKRRV